MALIKEIVKIIDEVKDNSKSSRLKNAFKESANINNGSNTSSIPFDNPRDTKGLEELKKEYELNKDDIVNFIGFTRKEAVKLLNSLNHSMNKKGFDSVSGENIYSKVFGRSIARYSGKNYYTISEICILAEANGTVIKI